MVALSSCADAENLAAKHLSGQRFNFQWDNHRKQTARATIEWSRTKPNHESERPNQSKDQSGNLRKVKKINFLTVSIKYD